jgi:putative ABC transport system permease protein
MIVRIAARNLLRNTRRTIATVLTVAIGAAALLVFAAFIEFNIYGLQTSTVQRTGHLTIFPYGYFLFGAGQPAQWGIRTYGELLDEIRNDAQLAGQIQVLSPIQVVTGIAASSDTGASTIFIGLGFIPSERDKMMTWDEYGTGSLGLKHSGLEDQDAGEGILGYGIARILGLCERLHMPRCPEPIAPPLALNDASAPTIPNRDFSGMNDAPTGAVEQDDEPQIQLLSATASGAPNVVAMKVRRTDYQGVKELDDAYVGMNLTLAQRLVYGRHPAMVTGIRILLDRTEHMAAARRRLAELLSHETQKLEIVDFTDLTPYYLQTVGLFRAIFSFIASIIGIVVVFAIGNVVSMNVVERTNEIGTIRALGVSRWGVALQFMLEGGLIALVGATSGLLLAIASGLLVNRSGLSWLPPGSVEAVPFRLYMGLDGTYLGAIWAGLVVVAVVASLVPAYRAAHLPVADALRHA